MLVQHASSRLSMVDHGPSQLVGVDLSDAWIVRDDLLGIDIDQLASRLAGVDDEGTELPLHRIDARGKPGRASPDYHEIIGHSANE